MPGQTQANGDIRLLDRIGRTENGRLWLFFILATLIAWLVWVPAAMVTYGFPGFQIPLFGLVGTVGPGIAAFLVAGIFEGRAGIRDLRRRVTMWRVGARWYGLAVFLPPVILLTAFYLYGALSGTTLSDETIVWSAVLVVIVVQMPNTLFEEIGWRGYAYPRLVPGRDPVRVGLLFGLFHTFWHLPYWLTSSLTRDYGLSYLMLALLLVVSMTVVFTWLWTNTKGSVLIAWLFHLALNTTSVFVPLSPEATGSLAPMALEVGLMVLVALVLAVAMERAHPRARGREMAPSA